MSRVYQIVTDRIVAALQQSVVPWRKPWAETQPPCNALTNRAYRGVNILLLSLAPYADHRWLTHKQVEERGGKVKPGEKSTLVVFWKRFDPPKEDDGATEKRQPHTPLLRYFLIFNVEQTEGLGLPALHHPSHHGTERIDKAELLVRSMPDPPRICEGKSAWYRPSDDVVHIPALTRFKTADAYYSTLFHELGHATGHERRLNRQGVTAEVQFGSGTYSQEELCAELCSAFCCATVELDNSLIDDSASYINGWLSILRNDAKALVIAAAQAQKAADYIKGVQYAT